MSGHYQDGTTQANIDAVNLDGDCRDCGSSPHRRDCDGVPAYRAASHNQEWHLWHTFRDDGGFGFGAGYSLVLQRGFRISVIRYPSWEALLRAYDALARASLR